MRRLRSRKEEVTDQFASQRRARFEDDREPADPNAELPVIVAGAPPTSPARPAAKAPSREAQKPASYTERLLQAKKQAQRKPKDNRPLDE
jgi:hypothetical protein